jgi:tetratricopeptide (TPR) repeat protein
VRIAETQIAVFDQLGLALMDTGHDRRAIPVLETVVALGELVEKKPMQTVGRLERVGLVYARVGLHANSVAAFGKAIEIKIRELGADSLQLSDSYVNLGNGYKRSEKKEDAERCYREALRILGVNHAQTPEKLSLVLLNLGAVCGETGRLDEAESNYREVLKLRVNTYGRNHWRVGNTYNNLANCLRRRGDFPRADEYIRQAIEILESRPESLANAYDTLSHIREDQGRDEEALSAAVRAREIQQNRTSPDLSEMASLLEREAHFASRVGDEDRAKDCRSRAGQIRLALAAAPPADRDLTNLPDALNKLGEHLQESLQRVKALQKAV